MASGASGRRRRPTPPDNLVVACWRVAALAPGGFVLGYLVGRGIGRLVAGCALLGSCGEPVPSLVAIPLAIVGMGAAAALAASRVRRWWEGVAVFGAGIASLLALVVLIGLLGVERPASRGLALSWLLVAIGVAVGMGRGTVGVGVRDNEN